MSEEFNKSDDQDLLPHTALGVVIDSGDALRDYYARLRDPEFTKKRLIEYYENTIYEQIAEVYKSLTETTALGGTQVRIYSGPIAAYFSLIGYKVEKIGRVNDYRIRLNEIII